jgi:two-component system, cell cycle sensor histidine kinase and response regulator CckA
MTTAKGNRRWVRTIAHPVREDGKVVRLRGSIQDITERRTSEDTLRRQASLIDQAYDAVLVWESNGPIVSWNKGAERMYGFSSAQAVGRSSHHLLSTPAGLVEQFTQALNGGAAWEGELHHVRSDGKRIVVESRMIQVHQDGRHYVLETNRDVSEKRLLEEQLRQSQKMEAIGQLAGGVAHDFNNLLGIILGCTELAAEYTELDKIRKRLAEIRKAADRASSLTRQLLAFSRKQVLEPKVIDLSAKVSEIADMLTRLVGEDVDVHTSLPGDLWSVRVDPSQFEQILLNLVVNAREAMPQGGKLTIETRNVELEEAYTRTHALAAPGRYVMISVSDSGIGMDAETQARIFEPFYTTKKTGTGLGLATVYGAVQQSGGNIWVYSELGKGTTFKIYLPAVEGARRLASADAPATQAGGSETILLVEDADALRAVTREFLELAGYTVKDAANGEQAVQIARVHSGAIDLLLTDVVMPGMSGPEVAKRVAQLHPEAKVLFMSGYTANAVLNHGALDNSMTLLSKPFSRASLTRKVRELLTAHAGTVPSSSGFD